MNRKSSAGIACALAAFAAAAAYWGTLNNGFTWDDHVHIESAPFVQDARHARVLLTPGFWTGRTEVEGSERPLVLASLLADRAVWGEEPGGYHLTNVLLHAACAAALAWLAWLLLGSAAVAALAGTLFALHPVQTEAVCEITFRADLIAALGVLLALTFLRLACARRSWAWAAAAAAAFAFGLMGKESAVVFPALAMLAEALFPSGARAARTRKTAAVMIAAVLIVYAAFRLPRGGYASLSLPDGATPAAAATLEKKAQAAPAAAPRVTTQYEESPSEWKQAERVHKFRLLTMSGVLGDYARLTLWPAHLQADRSATIETRWLSRRAWAGWAVLLLILAAALRTRRKLPAAAFGLSWFLIALAPVSDVIALPNLIAERYLYLAVAGAALAAAAAIDAAARRCPKPKSALLAASAAILAPAAAATLARVPVWRSDAALFGAPRETDSARVHYNLGLLAQRAGDLDTADAEYRRALALNPKAVEPLVNLAETARLRGNDRQRLELLRRAVVAAPRSAVALESLALALDAAGRRKEALETYARAVRADSRRPSSHLGYAGSLARAGLFDEARRYNQIAIELDPKSAAARYQRGRIDQEEGRLADAAADFREAVHLDPKHALAWENLGVCLHQSGDPAAALAPMKRAVELLPDSADVHRNLGAALDDLGRLEEAESEYETSAHLDEHSAASWHGYAVVLQKRGSLKHAEEAYQMALQIDPAKIESLVNLAGLFELDGRLADAGTLLEAAMKADPGRPAVINSLANLYRTAKRFADAARLYQLSLKTNGRPGDPPQNEALTHANLAASLESLGDELDAAGRTKEAVEAYQRALWADPDKIEPLLTIVRVDERDGHLDLAAELLEKARSADPGRPALIRSLADVYLMEKNFADAARLYELALASKPRPGDPPENGELTRANLAASLEGRGDELDAAGSKKEALEDYTKAVAADPRRTSARLRLAFVLARGGDYAEARRHAETAVELEPKSSAARDLLGHIDRDTGRPEDAIAAFREAVRLDHGNALAEEDLGESLRQSGDLSAALAHLRRAVELQPADARARRILAAALDDAGRVAREAGRREEALAEFREAAGLDPKNALAAEDLGVSLRQSGDQSSALDLLRRAVELQPGGAGAHRDLGAALADLGRGPEAEAELAEAVRLDPDDAEAWRALGAVRRTLGRVPEAAEAYRHDLMLEPKRAESLSNLAELYEKTGQRDEAQRLLERLTLVPGGRAALNDLGNGCFKARHFPDAGRRYELALSANAGPGGPADHAPAPADLILALESLGDELQASREAQAAGLAYERAVAAGSRRPKTLAGAAAGLSLAGRFDEALKIAQTAVELEPKSSAARDLLGRTAFFAGRPGRAAAAFQEEVRLDPKNGVAWRWLGDSLRLSGDPSAALTAARRAVELLPRDSGPQSTLGEVLADLHRPAEAEAAFKVSVELETDADCWQRYAAFLQKQGLLGRAAEAYDQALKLEPERVALLLSLADLRARAGDVDAAFALIERARALGPDDPAVRAAYDDILRRRGAARGGN